MPQFPYSKTAVFFVLAMLPFAGTLTYAQTPQPEVHQAGHLTVPGQGILFVVRRQYKPDHHNTETMFQTGEINTASFEGGGALRVLDPAGGNTVRTLLETPDGIIRDPAVHFDGDRILFSKCKNRQHHNR